MNVRWFHVVLTVTATISINPGHAIAIMVSKKMDPDAKVIVIGKIVLSEVFVMHAITTAVKLIFFNCQTLMYEFQCFKF